MYLWIKYVHIFTAIIALGTSAGLGIILEFFGKHPLHGSFILRAIGRLLSFFVIPGYVLMLVSGLWMVHFAWSITEMWIMRALILWVVGLIMLLVSQFVLYKEIKLFEAQKTASQSYRLISLLGRASGAAGGFIVVIILYYMVFKPQI